MRLSAKFEGGSSASAGRSAQSMLTKTASPRQNAVESAPSSAARNLALAHHIERLIEAGIIADYTQAARMLGVSQPRMTHLMGLLLLAPSIQEAILLGAVAIRDKRLRELARLAEWRTQELTVRIDLPAIPPHRRTMPANPDVRRDDAADSLAVLDGDFLTDGTRKRHPQTRTPAP